MTYISHSKVSQSVLDLTFVITKIAENIIDWTIDNEIMKKLDHEIIAFNSLSRNTQKVNSSLNATYNVQRADWKSFVQNLQSNYTSAKVKIQMLIQISNIEKMKKWLFYCVQQLKTQ